MYTVGNEAQRARLPPYHIRVVTRRREPASPPIPVSLLVDNPGSGTIPVSLLVFLLPPHARIPSRFTVGGEFLIPSVIPVSLLE